MYRNADGFPVLEGDGKSFKKVMTLLVDGNDLVAHNVRATWFGGTQDPEDDGQCAAPGINTRDNPDLLAVSLPVDPGVNSTKGSPIPRLPWPDADAHHRPVPGTGTMVRVWSHTNGQQATVNVIDIGPSKPPRANAAIDLTVALMKKLGGWADGEVRVDFRIINGVDHLSQAAKDAIANLPK